MLFSQSGWVWIQDPGPAALRDFQLTDLGWYEGDFNDTWLEDLAAQNLPLTRLYLADSRGFSGTGLSGFLTVTSLTLAYCAEISDTGLNPISTLPLLAHLDLDDCRGFTSKGVRALRGASCLERLSLASLTEVWTFNPEYPKPWKP